MPDGRTAAGILAAALVAGCAGMSEAECRGTDWYVLGKRDGEVYGSRSMLDQHAHRCATFGTKIDAAQYTIGWEDGNMEYRQRTGWGGGPD